MKRSTVLLSLALALSVTAMPAQALPSPETGGPAELVRFTGDPSSATGSAISNGVCDVDGDDVDDAVVGAWFWDKGATANVGAAYVLLGGADARGGDLADPAAAGAVRIDGYKANDSVAISVGCLGDVNGDGFDDIGIGDYINSRTFVIFGAEQFTGLSLDAIGDRGFIVKEDFTSSTDRGNLGYSMGAVGDINNDGLDDFALSAIVADTRGRNNNGKVWVIAGRDDISDVNVSAPAAGEVLLSLDGALADERVGSVAKAGDVNGDGIDDFVLGSYTSTPWGSSIAVPGAAYVVFGGNTGNIDLLTLGELGFKVVGPQRQRDRIGISVSAAGDVDGDGLADLLIGADGVANAATGTRNGGAAVVLGSASSATVYTDPLAANGQAVFTCPPAEAAGTCPTPTRRGYWINGAVAADATGYSVAGIGDVNGDGTPDFAIGAYGFDPVNPASPATTMSGAGATYVVHGKTSGTVQELSALTDASGYRIDGQKAGDRFGRQVGLIGDFDGNGARDLVIGADMAARGVTTQNGELTVALLGKLVTTTTVAGPASVAPTRDATFTANVGKQVGDQTPLAEGTVSFTLGGAAIDGCSALPVVGGTAICTAAFADEVSGRVVAQFDGSPRLQSSDAGADFAVVKTATTTALQSSLNDPKPGQLVQLRASVTDADAAAVDAGTVKFLSDGEAITGCKAVPLSGGDAVCTTTWSSRSEPAVTAEYSGTDVLAGSTSGAQTLVVGSDAVIKPSAAPRMTYGTAAQAFTGEIRGGDDTATGSVEVRRGSVVLGRSTLQYGEYDIRLGAKSLAPGSHTLTLVYSGDSKNRTAERSIAVAVAKASGKVTVSRSRSTLKRSQRLSLRVKVTAKGVAPTGKVQVKVGSKVVKTLTLKQGAARYKLPRFASTGTKKISVVYVGSSTVTKAVSKTRKVVQK